MANVLPQEKKITAVAMLCEGNSIRSIERMTGVHRDTVMRLGVRMGEGCKAIMDEKFRKLDCSLIEVDEVWGFIGMKQKTANYYLADPDMGDVWTWIALDAKSKLVPTFVVGGRSKRMANLFMEDLASRLSHRVQISADALASYPDAIARAFGGEVDFGSIVKTFSQTDLNAARRYSPPEVVSVRRVPIQGNPVEKLISTSYVEKQNHTLRMHCRRLSRLTNAFSKKLENFKDAIETMHRCTARHVASEPVIELFRGEVAWDGVVETFDLAGHPKAKRCHAWSYEEGGETQFVTVLELPPVDSPETAVKVAVAASAKQHSTWKPF